MLRQSPREDASNSDRKKEEEEEIQHVERIQLFRDNIRLESRDLSAANRPAQNVLPTLPLSAYFQSRMVHTNIHKDRRIKIYKMTKI